MEVLIMYVNFIIDKLNRRYVFVSDSKGTAKTSVFKTEHGKIADAVLGIPRTQQQLIEQWFHNKAEVVEITEPKYFYEGSFDLKLFLEHLS